IAGRGKGSAHRTALLGAVSASGLSAPAELVGALRVDGPEPPPHAPVALPRSCTSRVRIGAVIRLLDSRTSHAPRKARGATPQHSIQPTILVRFPPGRAIPVGAEWLCFRANSGHSGALTWEFRIPVRVRCLADNSSRLSRPGLPVHGRCRPAR